MKKSKRQLTPAEQKIVEMLTIKATNKYLIYLAFQEIMLDNYEDCNFLKDYNHHLYNKHRNMVASLRLNASKAYRFLQGYSHGDQTIKQFHSFVKIFEALHKAIDDDSLKYARMLDEIDRILQRYELKENDNLPIEDEPAKEAKEG